MNYEEMTNGRLKGIIDTRSKKLDLYMAGFTDDKNIETIIEELMKASIELHKRENEGK